MPNKNGLKKHEYSAYSIMPTQYSYQKYDMRQ